MLRTADGPVHGVIVVGGINEDAGIVDAHPTPCVPPELND
jgi:hypothetical protein